MKPFQANRFIFFWIILFISNSHIRTGNKILLKNSLNYFKFIYKHKLKIEPKQASRKIHVPIRPNAAGGGNAGSWILDLG